MRRHPRSHPRPAPPSPPPEPTRQRPQFSILGMLMVMLTVSVASAGAYYLVRADGQDTSNNLTALLFLLSAPALLVVVVSLVIAASRWFR